MSLQLRHERVVEPHTSHCSSTSDCLGGSELGAGTFEGFEGSRLTGTASRYGSYGLDARAGAPFCWGGILEHGGAGSAAATQMSSGLIFRSIVTGDYHTCGSASDGETYCWGLERLRDFGQRASGRIPNLD